MANDEYTATGVFPGSTLDAAGDQEAIDAVRFALTSAKGVLGWTDTDSVSIEVVVKRVEA